jgi:hypothetical protein
MVDHAISPNFHQSLVKEVRCCHHKAGRVHVVLGWILNSFKCATKQLAVVAAPNPSEVRTLFHHKVAHGKCNV